MQINFLPNLLMLIAAHAIAFTLISLLFRKLINISQSSAIKLFKKTLLMVAMLVLLTTLVITIAVINILYLLADESRLFINIYSISLVFSAMSIISLYKNSALKSPIKTFLAYATILSSFTLCVVFRPFLYDGFISQATNRGVSNLHVNLSCGTHDLVGSKSEFSTTTSRSGYYWFLLDKDGCKRPYQDRTLVVDLNQLTVKENRESHYRVNYILKPIPLPKSPIKQGDKSQPVLQTKPEDERVDKKTVAKGELTKTTEKESLQDKIQQYINHANQEALQNGEIETIQLNQHYFVETVKSGQHTSIFILYRNSRLFCGSGGCSATLLTLNNAGTLIEQKTFSTLRPPLILTKNASEQGFDRLIKTYSYLDKTQHYQIAYRVIYPYQSRADDTYISDDEHFTEIEKLLTNERKLIKLFTNIKP